MQYDFYYQTTEDIYFVQICLAKNIAEANKQNPCFASAKALAIADCRGEFQWLFKVLKIIGYIKLTQRFFPAKKC